MLKTINIKWNVIMRVSFFFFYFFQWGFVADFERKMLSIVCYFLFSVYIFSIQKTVEPDFLFLLMQWVVTSTHMQQKQPGFFHCVVMNSSCCHFVPVIITHPLLVLLFCRLQHQVSQWWWRLGMPTLEWERYFTVDSFTVKTMCQSLYTLQCVQGNIYTYFCNCCTSIINSNLTKGLILRKQPTFELLWCSNVTDIKLL